MIDIIPAVIPVDFADLSAKLARVAEAAPLVQIDIMDGKFVPNRSWPYGKPDQNFARMLEEEQGLPFWDKLDFEFDLMVTDPEKVIPDWIAAGAKRIIVHIESLKDPALFLAHFREQYGAKESAFVPELGFALGIDTPLDAVIPYITDLDFIQFMGIKRIGYQGEPFDERVLAKIAALREQSPETIISVDGGVDLETAPMLVSAGAQRLVSGSAIFGSENIIEAVREMKSAAHSGLTQE